MQARPRAHSPARAKGGFDGIEKVIGAVGIGGAATQPPQGHALAGPVREPERCPAAQEQPGERTRTRTRRRTALLEARVLRPDSHFKEGRTFYS
jgi:hypothetical protein